MRSRYIAVLALFLTARVVAGDLEEARRLFDVSELYYRAEAKVIAEHEAPLKEYAKHLLKARLTAIAGQRRALDAIARDKGAVKVELGGLCFFHIRNVSLSPDAPEYVALAEYSKAHPRIDLQYVAASERFGEEIQKASGTDRTENDALLKRFAPELFEDLPNQPPDRMPGSNAPGKGDRH